MWYINIFNGMLFSGKKEQNRVICRGVDGPRVCIQSEVSQKEKNKYRILMHICEIQKNGTDGPISRAGIETQAWEMDVWTWGDGEGGANWEIGIAIYALPCVKQMVGTCCVVRGAQLSAL